MFNCEYRTVLDDANTGYDRDESHLPLCHGPVIREIDLGDLWTKIAAHSQPLVLSVLFNITTSSIWNLAGQDRNFR